MDAKTVCVSICQDGDLVFLSPVLKVKENGKRIFGEVTVVRLSSAVKWKKSIKCDNPNFQETGKIKSIVPVGMHYVLDFKKIGQYEIGPIRERV